VAGRIDLRGALSNTALSDLYTSADAFVMSSLYEGYGMVLSEALAHGLPIVSTRAGAAAETVPDEAALKVEPGDIAALSQALRRVIVDTALRKRLAESSWAAGQRLPQWQDTARRIADVVAKVARERQ
jgi:glycosyltransferase involved in cell wall biosynthesis